MAVYKIFPASDATLYSKFPAQNTGLDEILEIAVKNNGNSANSLVETVPTEPILYDDIRRSLIRFSDADIAKIKTYTTGSWQAGLKLYLANAENLSTQYTVQIAQVSQSWDMGTGKFGDSPETRNGVCWYNTSSYISASNSWKTNSSQYYITPGGGSWSGSLCSQSFDYSANKDLNVDVTTIVNSWFSGSANNGFIAKFPIAVESSSLSYIALSYFSVDTHTIYPPTLEMRWDDSIYTGSLSTIQDTNFVVSIGNNQGNYRSDTGLIKFRVNVREKYPTRVFTTSSLYTTNKRLPQSSYWALQDVKTTDMIIDFDTNYTKISSDGQGSYLNLYMNGLEPERYYKLLIKTNLSSGELIDVDNDCIFKIVR